jgi:tetratricopeptide (TPR) repeat protein
LLLFTAGWILFSLSPVLSLESVGQNVFAERYLYIPSIGLCLFLPALAEHYGNALSIRRVQILAGAIVALYGSLTLMRNPVWRDEKSFCMATLAVSPDAAMMHQNLGIVYYKERNFSAALTEFEAARAGCARAFIPSVRDAYNALIGVSTVYSDVGRLEEAWRSASEARSLDPDWGEAYFLLGTIRSRQGRDAEAEPLLRRAVELNPADLEARVNLGSVLFFREKPAEAEEHFQAALKLEPQSMPARLGLAMCYARSGRQHEATQLVKEVLARDPGNPDALRLLQQFEPKTGTGR